jgi:hypothetical protein
LMASSMLKPSFPSTQVNSNPLVLLKKFVPEEIMILSFLFL